MVYHTEVGTEESLLDVFVAFLSNFHLPIAVVAY